MISVEQVWIPMRDGTRTRADVLRSQQEPQPVLLTRTPYGRPASRLADDVVGLAASGWTVVIADVRGCGDSEGVFDPFHQELADGFDTIGWLSAQAWSDGRVAMFGGSYRGATQWLAAAANPPGLGAVAPLMTTARFGPGWCSENGIPTAGFLRGWALRFVANAPNADPDVVARAQVMADEIRAEVAGEDVDAQIGAWFPPFRKWMDPTDSVYFEPLDLLARGAIAVPARQTAGWYDMFCEGGLEAYGQLSSTLDPATCPQRMLVGPWAHVGAGAAVVGDAHFGPGADGDRLALREREATWLRSALDPGPRADLGHRLSVYVLGRGDWVDLSSWPPANASIERWPLTARGEILTPGESDDAADSRSVGSRTVTHSPHDPLRTVGGRGAGAWPRPGPVGRDDLSDQPGDSPRIISYVSAPTSHPLTVIGQIGVDLVIDAPDDEVDVVLRVDCLRADGDEMLIVEQGTRVHRGAGANPTRLTAGSTAWHVGQGDRIRLSIGLASWPRLAVSPIATTVEIHHRSHASCALLLPCLASTAA